VERLPETASETAFLCGLGEALERPGAAEASSSARSAGSTRRPVLGRVHSQLPSVELEVVEARYRALRLFVTRELDESESARAAGLAIRSDVNADDLTGRGECTGELILGGIEVQIADEDFPWNGRSSLVERTIRPKGRLFPHTGVCALQQWASFVRRMKRPLPKDLRSSSPP
jgi:hypothetical protein